MKAPSCTQTSVFSLAINVTYVTASAEAGLDRDTDTYKSYQIHWIKRPSPRADSFLPREVMSQK